MSILVATDLSEHSRDAIRWASAYAADLSMPLHVGHVIDTLGDDELWTALFETPDEIERRVLSSASDRTKSFATEALRGVPTPTERNVLVAVGPPAHELDKWAKEKGAELVVCGTSGHGRLRNVLLGSTAYQLVHATHRPTVFVPGDAALPPVSNIVVALDFSDCSMAALEWASKVAVRWNAIITAVHGLGVSALSPDYEPAANFAPTVDVLTEQRKERIQEQLRKFGLEGRVVVSRHSPAEAIAVAAEDVGAELVVMGTHGRGAVGRLLLGSVALRVLRETKCAVATVHSDVGA
jgi:nucleotide-binding universal stress UspA family protein